LSIGGPWTLRDDEDVLCVVEKIRHYGLWKKVRYVVSRDGRAKCALLVGRGRKVQTRELRVRKGQRIRLFYPFWKQVRIGDEVALSQIVKHPSAPGIRRYWAP